MKLRHAAMYVTPEDPWRVICKKIIKKEQEYTRVYANLKKNHNVKITLQLMCGSLYIKISSNYLDNVKWCLCRSAIYIFNALFLSP